METPRSRQAARLRSRRRRAQQRARRIAVLAVVGAFAIVTLVLTAFGSSGSPPVSAVTAGVLTSPSGSTPRPESVATVTNLSIKLPIAQDAVTAIGFHASTTDGLALKPLGRQIDEGCSPSLAQDLRLLQERAGLVSAPRRLGYRHGSARCRRDARDVRLPPVDGTIASISDTILNGARARIPDRHPPDERTVGDPVAHARRAGSDARRGLDGDAGSTKIGIVADIAQVERQALARHTNDNGDNVAIEVHPAPASLP